MKKIKINKKEKTINVGSLYLTDIYIDSVYVHSWKPKNPIQKLFGVIMFTVPQKVMYSNLVEMFKKKK